MDADRYLFVQISNSEPLNLLCNSVIVLHPLDLRLLPISLEQHYLPGYTTYTTSKENIATYEHYPDPCDPASDFRVILDPAPELCLSEFRRIVIQVSHNHLDQQQGTVIRIVA